MGAAVEDPVYPAYPVERMCGFRKEGGVYSECGQGPTGRDIESFVIEGVPLPDDWTINPLGVSLVEVDGVWHIVDMVGAEHYPYPADVIEEMRRYGMSRRCEGIDYSKLTDASRHILVHPKGYIENWEEYERALIARGDKVVCPHVGHQDGEFCAGFWYHDLIESKATTAAPGDNPFRMRRRLPSLVYDGTKRPAGIEPKYKPALIAALPITRLVVVDGGLADAKMKSVSKAGIHVDKVSE